MICEACNENKATVHLTEITDDEKKELHLCEGCAELQQFSNKHPFFTPSGAAHPAPGTGPGSEAASLMCPQCGMTYAEFRQRGRLGCPNDYSFFQRGLEPLLERIHGTTTHDGKIPRRLAPSVEIDLQIQNLQGKMEEAVQQEEYEEAARLRDRIRDLEGRMGEPA